MKKFSTFYEGFTEKNDGNGINKSVTNHYTPIQNILTNINNLFCSRLGIVATESEDSYSIKLTSSKFKSEKAIDDLLYMPLYSDVNYQQSTLAAYIQLQGLNKITKINLGGYWVVYFSPTDIKAAENPANKEANIAAYQCDPGCCDCCCPAEMKESVLEEFEYKVQFLNESDDDEVELEDEQLKEILNLLNDGNKIKAAKALDEYISKIMELPDEYYFAGVKFKDGEESVALRWKYNKKLPHNMKVENTRSLMHIFVNDNEDEPNTIWVQDFDKESIVKLPKDVDTMIHNILDLFNAEETDDPAVFTIGTKSKTRKSKDEDKDEDKDKEEKKDTGTAQNTVDDGKKKKSEDTEEDVENDASRDEDEYEK